MNMAGGERQMQRIVKLGLSGTSLMVRQGGGYSDFLEFLDKKGMLT